MVAAIATRKGSNTKVIRIEMRNKTGGEGTRNRGDDEVPVLH